MKRLNKSTIENIKNKRTDLVELIEELNTREALPYAMGFLPGSTLSDIVYDDFEELVLDSLKGTVIEDDELIDDLIVHKKNRKRRK